MTCGFCGFTGEPAEYDPHDCYWVFRERAEAAEAALAHLQQDNEALKKELYARTQTGNTTDSLTASTYQPQESGNCPHCGAWVNFAQEAEITELPTERIR